jgi:hypothetical protein
MNEILYKAKKKPAFQKEDAGFSILLFFNKAVHLLVAYLRRE